MSYKPLKNSELKTAGPPSIDIYRNLREQARRANCLAQMVLEFSNDDCPVTFERVRQAWAKYHGGELYAGANQALEDYYSGVES